MTESDEVIEKLREVMGINTRMANALGMPCKFPPDPIKLAIRLGEEIGTVRALKKALKVMR